MQYNLTRLWAACRGRGNACIALTDQPAQGPPPHVQYTSREGRPQAGVGSPQAHPIPTFLSIIQNRLHLLEDKMRCDLAPNLGFKLVELLFRIHGLGFRFRTAPDHPFTLYYY